MIPYLLKSILCMAILLMVYQFFLEKEKMHRFNRCYLLGSMVFAAAVPLINIKMASQSIPALEYNYFSLLDQGNNQTIDNRVLSQTASALLQKETTVDWAMAIIFLYTLIAFMRLLRFTRNIYFIFSSVSKNKLIEYQSAKLVLVQERIASYSFLNYIFINEEDYNNRLVENEIITHELTHIRQKHSWDVIFVEMMQVFFWFNPILPFYKKAIQLNHEYLADDTVIKTYDNVPAYQQLLLEKIQFNSNASLTSNFNYSVTKKRFVMMTRKINLTRAFFKKLSLMPVLAAAFFTFSSKTIAQDNPLIIIPKPNNVPFTQEGVSEESWNELNAIVDKYINKTKNGHYVLENVGEPDRSRLEKIYLQMNKQQQATSRVVFDEKIIHKPSGQPSDAVFESFKDPAKFGVWLNGKKVTNDVLDKYRASDFGDYWLSNLNYTNKMQQDVMRRFNLSVMYEKQLELTTKEVAEKQYELNIADAKKHPYSMFFRYDKRTMSYVN